MQNKRKDPQTQNLHFIGRGNNMDLNKAKHSVILLNMAVKYSRLLQSSKKHIFKGTKIDKLVVNLLSIFCICAHTTQLTLALETILLFVPPLNAREVKQKPHPHLVQRRRVKKASTC